MYLLILLNYFDDKIGHAMYPYSLPSVAGFQPDTNVITADLDGAYFGEDEYGIQFDECLISL